MMPSSPKASVDVEGSRPRLSARCLDGRPAGRLAGVFEGFTLDRIDVGECDLRVRYGGSGPPVLLLHGHPRTHATWHRVAPLLARTHSVVCPDLRGYGESSKPATTADHEPYSKRAMARDCVALMHRLGHQRFAVVGHDRGGYVAFRTALDHPTAVTRLVVLDGVPIGEALARCDARFAAAWWHWFFFAQPDTPERVINADPIAWYGAHRAELKERMGAEAHADFRRAIQNPETVHAMLEDYRAGLGIDRRQDETDRAAGRTVSCPVLVVWSLRDDLATLYDDIPGIWRRWADDLRTGTVDSGHHMAEEAPDALASHLLAFLET
jgi:haloacetate dehalogenase